MQTDNLIKAKAKQIRVLYLATLILFLPLFAAIYFLYLEDSKNKINNIAQPEPIEPVSINLNSQVQTDAYSALVISLNTGSVLYEKNSDKQLPLASLTKIVTAKVAQDQIDSNIVSIDKMSDFPQYGDHTLLKDQKWNKEELIEYTLITSSNDGAHTLAQNTKSPEQFIQNMNSLVASIGLSNTKFYNETGLDDDSKGLIASRGTASDIAKILSYVIKTDLSLYEKTQHSLVTIQSPQGAQIATNTNEIANQIPGLLVSKTGYTDLAGGNLAVVADMGLNEPTAFIVLKSSKESRFDDVIKLQEAYFKQVRERMR